MRLSVLTMTNSKSGRVSMAPPSSSYVFNLSLEWTPFRPAEIFRNIISRVSNRVFVGVALCKFAPVLAIWSNNLYRSKHRVLQFSRSIYQHCDCGWCNSTNGCSWIPETVGLVLVLRLPFPANIHSAGQENCFGVYFATINAC